MPFPLGSPKVSGVTQDLSTGEYCCPGETYGISRSVHLGRLASFYPACRDCRRRDDTFGLSARHIRQLAEIGCKAQQPPWFYAEGVGKVAINDLSPSPARRIAIEFARRITPGRLATCPAPAVVVASDGRLATAAIVAAIAEGVRWAGCEAIDIEPASRRVRPGQSSTWRPREVFLWAMPMGPGTPSG